MIHQKKVRISSSLIEIPSTTNDNTPNDADSTWDDDKNRCCVTPVTSFGNRRRKNGFVMFRKSSSMSDVSNFKKGIDWSDDDVFLRDFNQQEKNCEKNEGDGEWCSGDVTSQVDPPSAKTKNCTQFHSFKRWTKKKCRKDDDVDSCKDKRRILTEDGRFKNIMSKISSIF